MTLQMAQLASVIQDAKPGFASGDDLDEGVFQIRMNNITRDGALDLTKKRRVRLEGKKADGLLVEVGDVMFNATNSPDLVGKSAYIDTLSEPTTFSNHFIRLRTNPQRLDGSYLARWLHTQFQSGRFKGLCRQWVNQATVSREALLGLEVPLLPLPEQRRIADILDQADALRAKRREALAQLDELQQSIFIEMFGDAERNSKGWPMKQLSELVADGDTINYGVVQPGDDLENGIPLIRVGDLIDGRVRHETLKRINPTIESAYKRSRLQGDEILVSCVGTIGAVALASPAEKGFNIARAVARIRLSEAANRVFMAAQLQSTGIQRYFTQELRTVSQPTLNIKQIAETKVMYPPLPLQNKFAANLAELEKVKFAEQGYAREINSLFMSLQHRAFRGEL